MEDDGAWMMTMVGDDDNGGWMMGMMEDDDNGRMMTMDVGGMVGKVCGALEAGTPHPQTINPCGSVGRWRGWWWWWWLGALGGFCGGA